MVSLIIKKMLVGIDFIYTNLKNIFKESYLEDVIFFGVNLKDTDFF